VTDDERRTRSRSEPKPHDRPTGTDADRPQDLPWRPEEGAAPPPEVPVDAPEADVLEQDRGWVDQDDTRLGPLPPDAPEADVLDQRREAGLDDEGREGEA
jgi:hypothetical protein